MTWDDPHASVKVTKVTLDDDEFTPILDFSKKNTTTPKRSNVNAFNDGDNTEDTATMSDIMDERLEQEEFAHIHLEPINGAFYASKRKGLLRRKKNRKRLLDAVRNALLVAMICHYGMTYWKSRNIESNSSVQQESLNENALSEERIDSSNVISSSSSSTKHAEVKVDRVKDQNKGNTKSEDMNNENSSSDEGKTQHEDIVRQWDNRDARKHQDYKDSQDNTRHQDHVKRKNDVGSTTTHTSSEESQQASTIPVKVSSQSQEETTGTNRHDKENSDDDDDPTFNGIDLKKITKESSGYIKFENGKIVRIEMGRENSDSGAIVGPPTSIKSTEFHRPPRHLERVNDEKRYRIPLGSYDSDELDTLGERVDEFKGYLNSIKAQAMDSRSRSTSSHDADYDIDDDSRDERFMGRRDNSFHSNLERSRGNDIGSSDGRIGQTISPENEIRSRNGRISTEKGRMSLVDDRGSLMEKGSRENNQEELQDFIQETIRKEIQRSIRDIVTNDGTEQEEPTAAFPFLQKAGGNNVAQASSKGKEKVNHVKNIADMILKQGQGDNNNNIFEKIGRAARRRVTPSDALLIIPKKKLTHCRIPLIKKMFKGCKKHNKGGKTSAKEDTFDLGDMNSCNIPLMRDLISKECMQQGRGTSFDVQNFVDDLI